MALVKKIWQQFKSQPDIWFFYGFLITFTLSIRKVLFFYPISDQFNEYTGIYLYLSDIFLILTILAWGYTILYNNKPILSNITYPSLSILINVLRLPRRLFPVEQSYWGGTLLLLPLALVIWAFMSLIWADNKILALFRSIKLIEFYLLYLYIVYNVPRLPRQMFHVCPVGCSTWNIPTGVEHFDRGRTFLKRSVQIIIASGVVQSLIAIYQFSLQHSIGLNWLHESFISQDTLGVAKLIINEDMIIRAYGLFPHPNILGGFLLISIIFTWLYHKLFHACPVGCSTWNICTGVEQFGLSVKVMGILIVQLLALIMTFSKSAILGLLIFAIYTVYSNVPRGTFSLKKLFTMFHVEHSSRRLFLSLGIIFALGLIFRPDTNSILFKSLNERILYLNVSRGTISENWLTGIGSGQFVLKMNDYVPRLSADSADGTYLESWQYQPVHNVFLLIWSELGIIGLGLFICWLWRLFHPSRNVIVPRGTITSYGAGVEQKNCQHHVPRLPRQMFHVEHFDRGGTLLEQHKILAIFKGAMLGLIFIMLFDHYLWDIQQGEVMLWLTAGLIVGLVSSD